MMKTMLKLIFLAIMIGCAQPFPLTASGENAENKWIDPSFTTTAPITGTKAEKKWENQHFTTTVPSTGRLEDYLLITLIICLSIDVGIVCFVFFWYCWRMAKKPDSDDLELMEVVVTTPRTDLDVTPEPQLSGKSEALESLTVETPQPLSIYQPKSQELHTDRKWWTPPEKLEIKKVVVKPKIWGPSRWKLRKLTLEEELQMYTVSVPKLPRPATLADTEKRLEKQRSFAPWKIAEETCKKKKSFFWKTMTRIKRTKDPYSRLEKRSILGTLLRFLWPKLKRKQLSASPCAARYKMKRRRRLKLKWLKRRKHRHSWHM